MEFRKIKDGVFLLFYKEKQFLIVTFPFKIYQLPYTIKNFKTLIKTPRCKILPSYKAYPGYFSLEFILSSNCNLSCKYCFAKGSNFGYYGLKKDNMPIKIAKNAIDFSLEELQINLLKNKIKFGVLDLYFMGGEPLLNQETLFFTLDYVTQRIDILKKTKNINITLQVAMSTNGTLLNLKNIKFFKKYNFNYIGITLDGPDHDKFRIYENGKGTLNDVISKIKLLIKNKINLKLLSVIPPGAVTQIRKIINFYHTLGILEDTFRVSIIPRAPSLCESDRLCAMPQKYIEKMNKGNMQRSRYNIKEKQIFARAIIDMANQNKIDERDLNKKMLLMIHLGGFLYHCPAGINKISVTPDGSIYPCHQFVNHRKFYMGNISNKKLSCYLKVQSIFLKRIIYKLDKCRDCILQTICPPLVDCPARSFFEERNIYKISQYCDIYYPYMLENLKNFFHNILQ